MKLLLLGAAFLTLCSCSEKRSREHANMIGMDSFALAARYSAPVSYHHKSKNSQRNYGGETAGFG